MSTSDFKPRVEQVKRAAQGHWPGILEQLGIPHRILNRKNQPCPLCGGRDRFQFTDKFGQGSYYCRGCGPGDGWKLLSGVLGMRFTAALEAVAAILGVSASSTVEATSSQRPVTTMRRLQHLWEEAHPIQQEDPAGQYLAGRRLRMPTYPDVLRCHAGLGYFVRDETGKSIQVARYPALLAAIHAASGQVVALHRTYLMQGEPPAEFERKKVLGEGLRGAAVRLFPATHELGIAEGIETALACHLATGKPVWASLGASNLATTWIPHSVSHVTIFADNDADGHFTGQAAAYALAQRLTRQQTKDVKVEVLIPEQPGEDWADVWLQRQPQIRAVA